MDDGMEWILEESTGEIVPAQEGPCQITAMIARYDMDPEERKALEKKEYEERRAADKRAREAYERDLDRKFAEAGAICRVLDRSTYAYDQRWRERKFMEEKLGLGIELPAE